MVPAEPVVAMADRLYDEETGVARITITGAASGIGAAVRKRLEANGDSVIGVDRRERKRGPRLRGLQACLVQGGPSPRGGIR